MPALKSAIGATFTALLIAAAPLPAFAGAAQDATLAKYVGTWSGSGALTGAEAGNITCKLTFKKSASKLTYSGRCSYSGGPGSSTFNGNISYNDSTGKYVAKSGGKSFNGSVSGGSIVFNMSQSDMRGTFASTLTLGTNIKFAVKVTTQDGDTSAGNVSFSKS